MLRGMGTDCTVINCRLELFSLEAGHWLGEEVYKIMSGPEKMGKIDCCVF